MSTTSPRSTDLAAILGGSSVGTQLVIEATDYSGRVLLQGRDLPWDDSAALVAHLAQVQALLNSVAVVVPLDRLIQQRLADVTIGSVLHGAMTRRSRPGSAARAFLADTDVKASVSQLVSAVCAQLRSPVLVMIPSPADLLRLTSRAVNGQLGEDPSRGSAGSVFGADEVESVSVYYSNWLRSLADTGVSGIVFNERNTATGLDALGPFLNVAEHYGWLVIRRQQRSVQVILPGGNTNSVGILPSEFWLSTDSDVHQGNVLWTEIPEEAIPEEVLSRLSDLRG